MSAGDKSATAAAGPVLSEGLGRRLRSETHMEHLCADCKHCKRHWLFGMQFATCESPQNIRTESVTGRKIYKFSKYAEVQRTGDVGDCADAGRWFEPKERRTIWMREF